MNILKNNRGFSLTEVMIAAGLVGLLALGNMTILEQNTKQQMQMLADTSAAEGLDDISQLLKDPDLCKQFLGITSGPPAFANGQVLPAPSLPGTSEIYGNVDANRIIRGPDGGSPPGPVLFATKENTAGVPPTIIGSNVEIQRFTLGPYLENDPANEWDDLVRLNIIFKRLSDNTYGESMVDVMWREVWLKAKVESNEIEECGGMATILPNAPDGPNTAPFHIAFVNQNALRTGNHESACSMAHHCQQRAHVAGRPGVYMPLAGGGDWSVLAGNPVRNTNNDIVINDATNLFGVDGLDNPIDYDEYGAGPVGTLVFTGFTGQAGAIDSGNACEDANFPWSATTGSAIYGRSDETGATGGANNWQTKGTRACSSGTPIYCISRTTHASLVDAGFETLCARANGVFSAAPPRCTFDWPTHEFRGGPVVDRTGAGGDSICQAGGSVVSALGTAHGDVTSPAAGDCDANPTGANLIYYDKDTGTESSDPGITANTFCDYAVRGTSAGGEIVIGCAQGATSYRAVSTAGSYREWTSIQGSVATEDIFTQITCQP